MAKKFRYINELTRAIHHFRPEDAEALSVRIHEAEAKNYEMSNTENRLWKHLTEMILKSREARGISG